MLRCCLKHYASALTILSVYFYFCRKSLLTLPENSVSEVLDTLFTLALVKRDKTARTLSLHRLVQAQFRFFLPLTDRQKAFNDAVDLVYAAFPTTDMRHGQLYNRWQECQLYSQHILSLKDNYKKEAVDQSEPLCPTNRFCQLLRNYFRYFPHP